jgi:hypothetical protein
MPVASLQSFRAAIAHARRIVARADWDARPTFCYRLRVALREALAHVHRDDDIDQRSRAVVRAAEHFANAFRPNFTPSRVELGARIDELDIAGAAAIETQANDHARAA